MALQPLFLASCLLLASANPAFVQPNLKAARPSRTVQLLASEAQAPVFADVASPDQGSLGVGPSLLLGVALGLLVSLAGAQRASAYWRWNDPEPPTRPTTKDEGQPAYPGLNSLIFGTTAKDFPEECNLWSKENKAEFTKAAYNLTKKGSSPYPEVPAKALACAKKKQEANVAAIPKFDPKYARTTTTIGFGAEAGVDRTGFGIPYVGKKIKPWSGVDGKIDKQYVVELGNNSKELGPYADPKAPGLGRENPKVRAWAEAQGLANINADGTPLTTPVGQYKGYFPNKRFGNSQVLLDMPFYKAKQ